MRRSVFMPIVVMGAAMVSGGWFLQQGVSQESNVYFQARLLDEVMDHIENRFVDEVDVSDLYESAIHSIVDELGDPNSQFLVASDWEDVRIRTEGEYGGVGLEVIDRDGYVTVVGPIPGTPGARAGVRPGDRIVEVDGESIDGWVTDQAVELLRGNPGTEVEMGIERLGVDQVIRFSITREVIRVRSVPFATMLTDKVGYVPLQIFNGSTTLEVSTAVDSLLGEGMEALILDLRENPGGVLDEGVGLTDMFLDPGMDIVETRGRAPGQTEKFVARARQAFPDLPVAVLVKERSASAAEIFAGALQDHDRALLIGAPTFGKGSVQSLYRLSGGNVLKLTTARWYTPSGRSIQKDRDDQLSIREHGIPTLSGLLAERPDVGEKPTFTTTGGRTVYGGGGITPDLWVLPDTLSTPEQEAIRAVFAAGGGFFVAMQNFAVEYISQHPNLRPDFRLTEADVARFQVMLSERGSGVTLEELTAAGRYVQHHLSREIALQAWDDQGQFEYDLLADLQLQKAIELLDVVDSQSQLFELAGTPLQDAQPAEAAEEGP